MFLSLSLSFCPSPPPSFSLSLSLSLSLSIQQVEEWSPDLIEIEECAKNVSRLIKHQLDDNTNSQVSCFRPLYLVAVPKEAFLQFFVVDNQTRALSSMVEISYFIGEQECWHGYGSSLLYFGPFFLFFFM